MLIHRPFGCDESHNPAGPHLIERFRDKVIVDQQVLPVIPLIVYLVFAKRDISYRQVKKVVRVAGVLKPVDGNICLLVKLFGNPACQLIQLHAVQPGIRKRFRHQAKKVADSHRRL